MTEEAITDEDLDLDDAILVSEFSMFAATLDVGEDEDDLGGDDAGDDPGDDGSTDLPGLVLELTGLLPGDDEDSTVRVVIPIEAWDDVDRLARQTIAAYEAD